MLTLSILTLLGGPLFYHWLRRGGLVARTFDRFMVIVLVALLAVILVPETFGHLGWVSFILIAAGYALPGLLESAIKRAARLFHLAALVLGVIGLMLHAMLDGAALAVSGSSAGEGLALAIVLHRVGVGLIIWLMVAPGYGRFAAWLVLASVALATVLGYELADEVLPLAGDDSVPVFQALIIGMIAHGLVHRSHGGAGHGHSHGHQDRA